MHPSTLLIALLPLLTATPTVASHNPPHLRHRKLAEQANARDLDVEYPRSPPVALEAKSNEAHREARKVLVRRNIMNRGQQCRPRNTSAQQVVAAATSSSAVTSSTATSTTTWSAAAATSSATNDAVIAVQNGGGQATTTSSSDWTPTSTSTSAWSNPTPSSSSDDDGFSLNVAGLLAVTDGSCGWCDSNDSQPNGAQGWLNCGVSSGGTSWSDGSGWAPPYVTMDQLIATELDASGVFAPCAQYIDKFKAYAGEFKVHPIMLASFAMQESTCNAGAVGGNGEAGLMQIAPPNCEAGNDCWNVDYNIRRGAQLFRQMIDHAGGNVLQAIGSYNGWQKGMTVSSATNAKNHGHCFAQNNLDYLFQFTNGWMQNRNAYSMGSYFNLNGC